MIMDFPHSIERVLYIKKIKSTILEIMSEMWKTSLQQYLSKSFLTYFKYLNRTSNTTIVCILSFIHAHQ